ncbi:zinc-binding dehydrogenase [Halosolutus gelatinilyticus]|uniref:zinc-binding dehydrogenase n=1 Tax=Halosolutus gelatinilyticus TaxID=2931975 RepID=UPI001FF63E43|nr:zinc-binding dehydrogenase [Halosolutus gelatinilyticus]
MASNETIVFDEPKSVEIRDRQRPDPGPGDVLIETNRTLVSTGTELTVLSGEYPDDSQWANHATYPFDPGYNNVGEIVEVGDDVEAVDVGQRVATYGSHAEYTVADADACRPIPDGVTDDEAAFFTIAEIVMNGVRRSDLTWGETAAVYGLGLLGQFAVRYCRLAGARPVAALDLASGRLEYLPEDGSVLPVDVGEADPETELREASGDRLADVVFEVTGNPNAITDELDVLRDQGRFVVLSSPRGETSFDFHDHCNAPSYRIIGAHNSSHPPVETPASPWTNHRHSELFFDLVQDGELRVDTLVSHRAEYADAASIYGALLEDRSDAMGVLLEW